MAPLGLKREPVGAELAVDWSSLRALLDDQTMRLVTLFGDQLVLWLDGLAAGLLEAKTIAVAAGLRLSPSQQYVAETSKQLTLTAMKAAELAKAELKLAGADGTLPPLDALQAVTSTRARVLAMMLAGHVASTAQSRLLATTQLSLTPEQVADVVTYLEGLQWQWAVDQIGGQVHSAVSLGRVSTFAQPGELVVAAAGTVYGYMASEMLDKNTCKPCSQVDGNFYPDMMLALIDYPVIGYKGCLGGVRCRGVLIPITKHNAGVYDIDIDIEPEDDKPPLSDQEYEDLLKTLDDEDLKLKEDFDLDLELPPDEPLTRLPEGVELTDDQWRQVSELVAENVDPEMNPEEYAELYEQAKVDVWQKTKAKYKAPPVSSPSDDDWWDSLHGDDEFSAPKVVTQPQPQPVFTPDDGDLYEHQSMPVVSRDRLQSWADDWNGGADYTHQRLRDEYVRSSNSLNNTLRAAGPELDSVDKASDMANVHDPLFVELPQATKVYRGMPKFAAGLKPGQELEDAVGSEFIDYGYMSTSASNRVAENFGGDNVLTTIRVPKGHPVLPIGDHMGYGEDELVLFRGNRMRVIGIDKSSLPHRLMIDIM